MSPRVRAHLVLHGQGGQLVEQDVVLGGDCSQAVAKRKEQAVEQAKRISVFLRCLERCTVWERLCEHTPCRARLPNPQHT